MHKLLLILISAALAAQTRHPVLVELFTSEGCSSCPPADALLQQLDKSQPVAGAQIVVLSEHVDYWDHDGWRDRFSSPAVTKRQRTYADHFHLDEVYTPQMVVDGAVQVLGSDQAAALRGIEGAGKAQTINISVSALPGSRAEIKIDPSTFKGEADVFLAIADNDDTTEIKGGENKGRTLHHVAVMRSLAPIGKISSKNGLTKEVPFDHSRLIVFVQEPKQGRILGSAMLTPP